MIFKYIQENLEDWRKLMLMSLNMMGKESERGGNSYVLSIMYLEKYSVISPVLSLVILKQAGDISLTINPFLQIRKQVR